MKAMTVKIISTTRRYCRHWSFKLKKSWEQAVLATVGPVFRVEPATAPKAPAKSRSIPTVIIASFRFSALREPPLVGK